MTALITGRCFCERIGFVVRGPERFACFCYCESCQRAAGAPLVAWATYERDTFSVTRGEIHYYRSSPGVTRGLCSNCGSSITYENEKRPGEIDITLNTFDEPGATAPRAHIWTEDKQPWLRIADNLLVYEKNIG
mgnify:FL=1